MEILGIVTLYNPAKQQAVDNIKRYIDGLDELIIWDNSPLEAGYKSYILPALSDHKTAITWYGTGENLCIAPAINFAWRHAQEQGYDMLLIMDQDSQWQDFAGYRQQIEEYWTKGNKWVYTPYIKGFDNWPITQPLHFRRIFINSGTVIPVEILTAIQGADEAFPLDALDHDLSYQVIRANYQTVCLTNCVLNHTIGQPRQSKILHIVTNDYGRARTYSRTKCHIMNFRKNYDVMTLHEKYVFFKRIFISKFFRIIMIEEDKAGRLHMFFRGIRDGMAYKFQHQ
ncbi:MAG: hypothetical protein IJ527_06310 [Prevotella sp.]|nr:hypothetical protein [Prevotella sp.]